MDCQSAVHDMGAYQSSLSPSENAFSAVSPPELVPGERYTFHPFHPMRSFHPSLFNRTLGLFMFQLFCSALSVLACLLPPPFRLGSKSCLAPLLSSSLSSLLHPVRSSSSNARPSLLDPLFLPAFSRAHPPLLLAA
eukprot:2896725-Rhodomonas_salina.2